MTETKTNRFQPAQHVFGVVRSILGRPWRWRGGPPGDAADAQRMGIDDVTARLRKLVK